MFNNASKRITSNKKYLYECKKEKGKIFFKLCIQLYKSSKNLRFYYILCINPSPKSAFYNLNPIESQRLNFDVSATMISKMPKYLLHNEQIPFFLPKTTLPWLAFPTMLTSGFHVFVLLNHICSNLSSSNP